MPVTIAAEPAIIEGATRYAEQNGVTLERLMLDYLASVARIVREYKTPTPKRRAGGLTGEFYMAPDFDEPLEDFAEYM